MARNPHQKQEGRVSLSENRGGRDKYEKKPMPNRGCDERGSKGPNNIRGRKKEKPKLCVFSGHLARGRKGKKILQQAI